MKDFFNRVPFEYILAGFIISAALLIGYNLTLCIVPLLLIALLIAWKINTARGIFLSLFLIMIIIFNLHHNDNKLKNALGGRPVYGTIQFEIIDPLCCSLAEIRNGTTMLIKIINIKTADGEILTGDGKFLVYAKDIINATASYGDVFEIHGTLRFADEMGVWNSVNEIVDYASSIGMPGIGYLTLMEDGSFKGPIDKFLSEVERDALIKEFDMKTNSVMFFIANKKKKLAQKFAGQIRIELGKKLELIAPEAISLPLHTKSY